MTGLWSYPWSLERGGTDAALKELAEVGVDRLKVAAHYHSVQTLDPGAADPGFEVFPGGALFDPDPDCFERTPIRPPTTAEDDSFGAVVQAVADHGISLDAWTVCLHGTRLASDHPDYRIEDAFGGAHDHALCPSNPAVRDYFAGVVANIARYDVDRIDLESIGFPTVFHNHGADFGHHKDHAVTSRTEEFLLSQCFCDGCRRAADGILDLNAAEDVVRRLCRRILEGPERTVPSLNTLRSEYPMLEELFAFRERVIGTLLADLAEASRGTSLGYYLADGGAYTPEELWPAGVTPALLERHLDGVTALCYTGDSEEADRRLQACRRSLGGDLAIDAGITFDPAIIDGRDHWLRLAERVKEGIDGNLFVYNGSLMTDAHREWLAAL